LIAEPGRAASPPVTQTGWRAVPADQLSWADWDSGHALYHRLSGKTHFLNPTGAALLRELLANPGEAYEIDEADQGVRELVLRFEMLGLVERVAP
jgi:hypothetical protein